MLRIPFLAACIFGIAATVSFSASRVESVPWKIEGKIVGKNGKKSEDVSGIACAQGLESQRQCLLIDDNLQAAQIVTLRGNGLEAGELVPLIEDSFAGKRLELDGEGVAFSDGAFYVVGSHGHPRDKDHKLDAMRDKDLIAARIKAASQVIQLTLQSDGTLVVQKNPISLTAAINSQPELLPFAGKRLDENGLTIEGIAIVGDRFFVGFRGPVLSGGKAPVLSISLKALLSGATLDAKLFELPLGAGVGVRDLAVEGDHLLVLAGPSADVAGPYAIYLWDGATNDGITPVVSLTNVAGAGDNRKAEAILSLSTEGKVRKMLLFFDGEKEGSPLLVSVSSAL